jgi:hypothetical protein
MIHKKLAVTVGCALLLLAGNAHADDYVLTLKDHKFAPEQLVVPAGQKIKVIVRNMDKTPAEFESFDLNREKVIKGGEEVTVVLGPLDAGSYKIFDDFHKDTAAGTIKAQ